MQVLGSLGGIRSQELPDNAESPDLCFRYICFDMQRKLLRFEPLIMSFIDLSVEYVCEEEGCTQQQLAQWIFHDQKQLCDEHAAKACRGIHAACRSDPNMFGTYFKPIWSKDGICTFVSSERMKHTEDFLFKGTRPRFWITYQFDQFVSKGHPHYKPLVGFEYAHGMHGAHLLVSQKTGCLLVKANWIERVGTPSWFLEGRVISDVPVLPYLDEKFDLPVKKRKRSSDESDTANVLTKMRTSGIGVIEDVSDSESQEAPEKSPPTQEIEVHPDTFQLCPPDLAPKNTDIPPIPDDSE